MTRDLLLDFVFVFYTSLDFCEVPGNDIRSRRCDNSFLNLVGASVETKRVCVVSVSRVLIAAQITHRAGVNATEPMYATCLGSS